MKNKRLWVAILAGFMAIVMLLGLFIGALPKASAASSSEIKNQINEIEKEQAGIQDKINALEGQKKQNLTEMKELAAQKDILDQQVGLLNQQIENLNQQIAAYAVLIADKQEELQKAQQRLEELNKKNKERIRAMEEDGSLSYWAVIFKANSFSDLLDRISMMEEIAASDRRRLKEMSEAAEIVAEAEKTLCEEQAALVTSRETLMQKQAQMDAAIAESQTLLMSMKDKDAEFQKYLDEAEDLSAKLTEEIDNMKVEYDKAKYQEWLATSKPPAYKPPATGGGGVGGSASDISGVTWVVPCDYVRVSSTYGPRVHPISGEVGKMHHGVDLAVGCTPIYATRAGVVITNSFQAGGAGWYVTIDHGDGYRSLYMHMCKRSSVTVGQFVGAGEVIGCVGSTGGSTGSHLHFEIRKLTDGVWGSVDPMKYIG